MSNLADTISEGIKDAMRSKDRDRLAALRDIKSKILLEATKDNGSQTVDDDTTLAILSKLLKQRTETAALYREQGRPDLAVEEEAQASVIQEFLPVALTEEKSEPRGRHHRVNWRLVNGGHGKGHGPCLQSHGWASGWQGDFAICASGLASLSEFRNRTFLT